MKRILLSLLLLFSLDARGRALDFRSELRLAKSGELAVTERITVEAQEGAPGLERELPAAARVVDVIRNGHPELATQGRRGRSTPQVTINTRRSRRARPTCSVPGSPLSRG